MHKKRSSGAFQSLKGRLRWLEKQMKEIDDRIEKVINGNEEMRTKAERIQLVKGLGKGTAATLLAYLPELGTLSRNRVSALGGLAPYNRDSGNFKGNRHIHGGRKRLRACLYMAAMSAIRCNPEMKEFYRRLVEDNHRPKKVALVAVMRKLLIVANSAVKNPEFLVAN